MQGRFPSGSLPIRSACASDRQADWPGPCPAPPRKREAASAGGQPRERSPGPRPAETKRRRTTMALAASVLAFFTVAGLSTIYSATAAGSGRPRRDGLERGATGCSKQAEAEADDPGRWRRAPRAWPRSRESDSDDRAGAESGRTWRNFSAPLRRGRQGRPPRSGAARRTFRDPLRQAGPRLTAADAAYASGFCPG